MNWFTHASLILSDKMSILIVVRNAVLKMLRHLNISVAVQMEHNTSNAKVQSCKGTRRCMEMCRSVHFTSLWIWRRLNA